MSAMPVGSVTRRDGVLNVASHTPINSNPPDLGPKGYFSQISNDQPGGNGSTKLHSAFFLLFVVGMGLTQLSVVVRFVLSLISCTSELADLFSNPPRRTSLMVRLPSFVPRRLLLILLLLTAVNVMLWSADTPAGKAGMAAWDLFRAEDSDKVRLRSSPCPTNISERPSRRSATFFTSSKRAKWGICLSSKSGERTTSEPFFSFVLAFVD